MVDCNKLFRFGHEWYEFSLLLLLLPPLSLSFSFSLWVMEIPFTRKLNDRYWFTVFTPFILLLLIYLSYSSTIDDTRGVSPLLQNLTPIQSPKPNRNDTMKITSDSDSSCSGRFIYVHNLPSRFNDDLFKNCESLLKWNNMCRDSMNMGLGPPMENPAGRVLSNKSWFATNQFLLEMIFRNRMKQYKCLTNDSTKASAVFVPFYAGLEVGRYLWGGVNTTVRDSASLDLVKWLSEKPEWKALWGRDHFLISGRTAWDFYRTSEEESNWGNKLMFLPESKNMTMLTIESTGWNNNFAIPYPTYFHPTKDIQVLQWQNKMRRHKRPYLFSFVGAPRPNLKGSIRGEIIHQCQTSKKCKLLDCNKGPKNMCLEPGTVMKMFQKSVFCLQPAGDSYTRRSIFDSILAGCIPVFFYPRSAYVQYIWHLPKNHTKYSVYIPVDDIKDGKANIEKILHGFSRMETKALSEEVIRLIPSVIYANPMRSGLETFQDAFDVAVKGVLDRVERIRRDISEGRTSSLVFGMKSSWIEGKYE